jgi:D-amino-acid dehydrogenase
MARQLTELGDPVEAEAWMGRRPCLPGMLPFVNRLPRHRTLWGNFGHGHQGFTLGPTTGRLLADRMAGKP